jgi:hypothetical protein
MHKNECKVKILLSLRCKTEVVRVIKILQTLRTICPVSTLEGKI